MDAVYELFEQHAANVLHHLKPKLTLIQELFQDTDAEQFLLRTLIELVVSTVILWIIWYGFKMLLFTFRAFFAQAKTITKYIVQVVIRAIYNCIRKVSWLPILDNTATQLDVVEPDDTQKELNTPIQDELLIQAANRRSKRSRYLYITS